jgi:hypothetical protein
VTEVELMSRIISERRRQANFQLIVITHDEGFLQRLAAHDVLEYYWWVSSGALWSYLPFLSLVPIHEELFT